MCVYAHACVHACAEMQVLMRVVVNPYIYMDKVAVMVQEAVCLQAKLRGQDTNTSCVPISHIDGKQSFSFTDMYHTKVKIIVFNSFILLFTM